MGESEKIFPVLGKIFRSESKKLEKDMLKVLRPEKPAKTIISDAPPTIRTKMDMRLMILITFCELLERT